LTTPTRGKRSWVSREKAKLTEKKQKRNQNNEDPKKKIIPNIEKIGAKNKEQEKSKNPSQFTSGHEGKE
jgi:hypothetical protein